MRIGEIIKKRREELELTQLELARSVGYEDKSTITKIENGQRDFPRKRLTDFAKALGMSVDELMPDEGLAVLANELSPREYALILAFRDADPMLQDRILRKLGVR